VGSGDALTKIGLGLIYKQYTEIVAMKLWRRSDRATVLKAQFAEIDVLNYRPSYEEAAQRATAFLRSLK
jgi:hypothetical protein